jgi:MFS family permease
MFAIGIGWNLAFVAATALIADATEPHERARVLGLSDLVGVGLGALGSAVGAAVFGTVGVLPLAIAGALLAVLPAALIARRPATAVPAVAGLAEPASVASE